MRERTSRRDDLIAKVLELQPVMSKKFEACLAQELHEELCDVTIHQLSVLKQLSEGPVAMRDLAKALEVCGSSATAAADRLVRQNLVRRLDDPTDRRVVLLALTDEGRALADRVRRAVTANTSRILGALSEAQLEQLVEILGTLRDSLALQHASDAAMAGASQ